MKNTELQGEVQHDDGILPYVLSQRQTEIYIYIKNHKQEDFKHVVMNKTSHIVFVWTILCMNPVGSS